MALDPTICFLGIGQEPHQLLLVKPGNQPQENVCLQSGDHGRRVIHKYSLQMDLRWFLYSQETMRGELFTSIAYEWTSSDVS